MAYPDRIATLDPDTPDIDITTRKVTFGEGPIPAAPNYDEGVSYNPNVGFGGGGKSGFWSAPLGNAPDASSYDPATYLSLIGFSKTGWGRLNYITEPFDIGGFDLFGWSQGAAFTTIGGPNIAPLQASGVYDYQAAKDYSLSSFEGGTVTFTPSYETISVDWGITSAQGPANAFSGGTSEAPLSTSNSPAVFQPYHFNLAIDPEGINDLVCALEMRDNLGTLELNTKILFSNPSYDAFHYEITSVIWTSPDTPTGEVNWAINYLTDDIDSKVVLTSFEYLPMWPSSGVLGTPVSTNYFPLFQTDDGTQNIDTTIVYSVTDGFIFNKDSQWYLVKPDWSTYQRINLIAGEQSWCDVDQTSVRIIQDIDGTFLVLTEDNPGSPEATAFLWIDGEIAPGFNGCDVPPPLVVPPEPTIVTGDVIVRAFPLSLDGHDMYILRLGLDQTLVYDKYSKEFSEWSSYSNAVWAVNSGFEWSGGVGIGPTNLVVGDDTTGTLYFLDPEQPYDDAPTEDDPEQQLYFDRIVMGQVTMRGRNSRPCYSVFITGDMGQPAYEGASMSLYTSDDAGVSWTDQGSVVVNEGNFTPELLWRSLGVISAPGRLFMFIDDGAVTRIDDMEMNDDGG